MARVVCVTTLLAALTACGPRVWSEIHGPTASGGLDVDAIAGPSPRIELGYSYQRSNFELGYGLTGSVAGMPLSKRLDILAELHGSLMGIPGLNGVIGPALSIGPQGAFPGLVLGLELAVFDRPPKACCPPAAGGTKTSNGWQGCADDDWFEDDTMYPDWIPRHRLRAHLIARRDLDHCAITEDCIDGNYSVVAGLVLASHWLFVPGPQPPSKVANPYPITHGTYDSRGELIGGHKSLPRPPTDEQCRRSRPCADRGMCTASGRGCLATRHADCRRAKLCRTAGRCFASPGECIARRNEDCAQSEGCRREGKCAAENGRCRPDADEHCEQSEKCRKEGSCEHRSGACRVTEEHCSRSEACRIDGRCAVKENRCVPANDGDCAKSSKCRSAGLCGKRGSSCAPVSTANCAKSTECRSQGRCVYDHGRCRADSEQKCRQSLECRRSGKCGLSQNECRATKREHCVRSQQCKTKGWCRLWYGRCEKGAAQ